MKKPILAILLAALLAGLASCTKKGHCHNTRYNFDAATASGSDYDRAKANCEAAPDAVWVDE